MKRRGDDIPPVSDYAHWNEDAYAMWYEENKYDMQNADEIIEDDDYDSGFDDWMNDLDPDLYVEFETKEEADKYFDEHGRGYDSMNIRQRKGNPNEWVIEGWSTEYMQQKRSEYKRRMAERKADDLDKWRYRNMYGRE